MKKGVMIAVIVLGVLVLVGALSFVFKDNIMKMFSQGNPVADKENAQLTVYVTASDNTPITPLEVDLWEEAKFQGAPANVSITDSEGKVNFIVPAGKYFVGFNSAAFPSVLTLPPKELVKLTAGNVTKKDITLEFKR
jgi:hypothetical protein